MRVFNLQLDEADLNQIIRALYDHAEDLYERFDSFPKEDRASVRSEVSYCDELADRLEAIRKEL